MNIIPIKYWLTGIAMIAAAILTLALTPNKLASGTAPKIDLNAMIPNQFGDWHQLQELDVISVSPQTQATLNKIYQQTLSRTYENSSGQQVMLALAYGNNQNDNLQVHRPEICYPAQGFQILKKELVTMHTQFGDIPTEHLIAKNGERVEPITYWITVGDQVAATQLQRKLAQLKYGFTGSIPDGMLVRVSSIGEDYTLNFSLQQAFVNAMLNSVAKKNRLHLIGSIS
jgi:EpsI family protein